jgi:hypothetical protein
MSTTNEKKRKNNAADKKLPKSKNTKNDKKRKNRTNYEENPNVMLKRFAATVQEKEKHKKKPLTPEEQLKADKTKARRRVTNQRRRALGKVAIQLLKEGLLYTKEGKQYQNCWNIMTIPDDKTYIGIINNSESINIPYKDENDLADIYVDIKKNRRGEKEFFFLLQKVADGDEMVIDNLKKKKVVHEITTEVDVVALKEAAKKKLSELSKKPVSTMGVIDPAYANGTSDPSISKSSSLSSSSSENE